MAVQGSDIGDLVATTLYNMPRLKFTQAAQTLQDYWILPQFMGTKRATFDGGTGIEFRVMTSLPGGVENVGLYHEVTSARTDVMTTGSVPWRWTVTNWIIDDREVLMNSSSSEKIIDIMETQRVGSTISMIEHVETDGWGKPTDSTDDTTPFGFKYWIVRNPTDGFTGGNPSGFSAGCAGIDSSTYASWKNYSATWSAATKINLVRKWRAAFVKTKFKSPKNVNHRNLATADQYGFYTGYDSVIAPLEEVLESQNDNLGPDVARYDGELMFRRTPVNWVPALDSDTETPIYGINWGTFKMVFLKGMYLAERGPVKDVPNQPTVNRVHVQLGYNIICYDRRRNFVLYNPA